MKNFQEILDGIPLTLRIVGKALFIIFILYITYTCIRYVVTENVQYAHKLKKSFLLITVVISTELLMCYFSLFHSCINVRGLEQITDHSYPATNSTEFNNDESLSQCENKVVIFANDKFSIENSDHLEISDIVSGEVSLQEVNETIDDIWYQYVLIPTNGLDESVAIGSYRDVIVTSRCVDIGWNITCKGEGGS